MKLKSWLGWATRRDLERAGRTRRPALRLEALEDRTTPAAGLLDPTFGTGGVVTTDVGTPIDFAHDLAVQADGKLVVAGNTGSGEGIAVARYNPDGTPDATFDGDGLATRFRNSPSELWDARAVVLQADGRVVVVGTVSAGSTGYQLALWRYNADGSFDTSTTTDPLDAPAFGINVDAVTQPDGRIVVGSNAGGGPSGHPNGTLARFNADLRLDPSFDGDGLLTAPLGFTVADVALQADGKIVAAGWGLDGFCVARFNGDGTPDTGFGHDGVASDDLGRELHIVVAVAVQPDGRIVVAGTTDVAGFLTRIEFTLARFNPNGQLDGSFGHVGVVTTDFGVRDEFGRGEAWASAMTLQADGRIVVVGTVSDVFGANDIALARYDGDGSLDTDFDAGGLVTTDLGGTNDLAAAVAVQADGKIVVAGVTLGPSGTYDFAALRYEGLSGRDGAVGAIAAVVGRVESLVSAGALTSGQGKGLLAKLQAAIQQADRGRNGAAVSQLEAFTNQVNDLVGDGILTSAQGWLLLDDADEAIALLL